MENTSTSSEKNWRNTSLQHADLQGTRFSKTDFTGSTFLHANTYLADFSDCIWDDVEIDFNHQFEILSDFCVQYLKKNGLDKRPPNFEKFLSRICAARKLESLYGNCTSLFKLLNQWPDNRIIFSDMKGFDAYIGYERSWKNLEKSHEFSQQTETARNTLRKIKLESHYSEAPGISKKMFFKILLQDYPELEPILEKFYMEFEQLFSI